MSSSAQRPNVVFINTDQQHAGMMSCTGNPWLKTPAMDRIANEGIRFERAYCSNPVCLPSRFSWFTGRMPSELGIWDNKNPHIEEVPAQVLDHCIGRLLKNAGYRVGYGGKVHLPGDMSPETMGCENITEDKRDDLASVSADWIKDRAAEPEQSFFLSLCLVNPHDICFMGMREYVRETRKDDSDLNVNERWLLSDDPVEMTELNKALQIPEGVSEAVFFDRHCPPLPPNHEPQQGEAEAIRDSFKTSAFRQYIRDQWDEKTWRMHRWAYCRLTERVDQQITVILDALDEAGLADNTLVIFTSDHGDHDGSHKLDQKTIPYEEAARIPLALRWPQQIRPGQIDTGHVVSNGLDVLPTICAAAGVSWPDDLCGKDLMALAGDDKANSFHEAVPIECKLGRAIVRGAYKYMRFNNGERSEQLFDLNNDPHETRNHLDDPELADDLATCRAAFDRLFQHQSV